MILFHTINRSPLLIASSRASFRSMSVWFILLLCLVFVAVMHVACDPFNKEQYIVYRPSSTSTHRVMSQPDRAAINHRQPAGLSRVNGVRRSSAYMKLQLFAKSTISYQLSSNKFGVDDYVREEVTSRVKVGSSLMSGRDATWGQHIRVLWLVFLFLCILQQSYIPYQWTDFRTLQLKRRSLG